VMPRDTTSARRQRLLVTPGHRAAHRGRVVPDLHRVRIFKSRKDCGRTRAAGQGAPEHHNPAHLAAAKALRRERGHGGRLRGPRPRWRSVTWADYDRALGLDTTLERPRAGRHDWHQEQRPDGGTGEGLSGDSVPTGVKHPPARGGRAPRRRARETSHGPRGILGRCLNARVSAREFPRRRRPHRAARFTAASRWRNRLRPARGLKRDLIAHLGPIDFARQGETCSCAGRPDGKTHLATGRGSGLAGRAPHLFATPPRGHPTRRVPPQRKESSRTKIVRLGATPCSSSTRSDTSPSNRRRNLFLPQSSRRTLRTRLAHRTSNKPFGTLGRGLRRRRCRSRHDDRLATTPKSFNERRDRTASRPRPRPVPAAGQRRNDQDH